MSIHASRWLSHSKRKILGQRLETPKQPRERQSQTWQEVRKQLGTLKQVIFTSEGTKANHVRWCVSWKFPNVFRLSLASNLSFSCLLRVVSIVKSTRGTSSRGKNSSRLSLAERCLSSLSKNLKGYTKTEKCSIAMGNETLTGRFKRTLFPLWK